MKYNISLNRLFRFAFKKIAYPYLHINTLRFLKKIQYPRILSFDKKRSIHNIAYFRTEFWAESNTAGGAVAHTKGIVEGFSKLKHDITVFSGFTLGYIEGQSIKKNLISPNVMSYGFDELQELEFNKQFINAARKSFEKNNYSFVYQRYGLNNYAGAFLSSEFKIPLILEYNGSEIWIAKHWKNGLKYEAIAEKIEIENFSIADLVIVNAQALKDELIGRGILGNKICVIPNGVDPSRFNPKMNVYRIREKYGIDQNTIVVSFLGTFGKWHGAEVLAKAVKQVIHEFKSIHFLFIGEGATYSLVNEIIKSEKVEPFVTFTKTIPQLETPEYIAACDIMISPQIPNKDGTPFFGSPTKLFEYMAMGKSIVASDLDQIGEILKNNESAILVKPEDENALAKGILKLAKDKNLRTNLGMAAYKEVINKHTWEKHIEQVLIKLKEIV